MLAPRAIVMLYNNSNMNILMNIKVHLSIQLFTCLLAAVTARLDMASYALTPNRER